MTALTGSFSVDGEPVVDGEVLAFDGDPRRLRATTITGAGGSFELTPLAGVRPALLARLRASTTLALAGIELEDGASGPVTLAARGPLCELTVTLNSDEGYPEELELYLDPIRVEPLPTGFMPFVKQLEPGVMSTRFWEARVAERQLKLRVQAGIWRVGGASVVHDGPELPGPDPRSYVVGRALAAATMSALPGDARTGFELDLREDSEVVLELRC